MELLINSLLFVHVTAGVLTLLAGPAAILSNTNQLRWHRLSGKVFFFAMLVTCFSSILTYFRHPEKIFYQFLLGIAFVVLGGLLRGVRAVTIMKNGRPGVFDFLYTLLLGITGTWMLYMAVTLFMEGTGIAFPILFGVFGGGAVHDALKNFHIFSGKKMMSGTDWLQLHLNSMIGAFIASTTAFTVNTAHYLPWFVQWFGPTVLLVPVMVWFSKKIKAGRAFG